MGHIYHVRGQTNNNPKWGQKQHGTPTCLCRSVSTSIRNALIREVELWSVTFGWCLTVVCTACGTDLLFSFCSWMQVRVNNKQINNINTVTALAPSRQRPGGRHRRAQQLLWRKCGRRIDMFLSEMCWDIFSALSCSTASGAAVFPLALMKAAVPV